MNKDLKPIMGIELILLFRDLEEAATKPATKMAFQTEHSMEASKDSDSTETKDGAVTTSSTVEEEITVTTIMAREDPTADFLEEAFYDNKIIEVWEIDKKNKNEEGLYKAEYRQCKITDFSKTASAEDPTELELTLLTNGQRQKGYTPLSKEQEKIAQYVFRDTEVYKGEENEKNAIKKEETTETNEV